jgi:deferrochelatase/peroxidase EfeB
MYDNLKSGVVADLEPLLVPSGNLNVLLGFGAPAFDNDLLAKWPDPNNNLTDLQFAEPDPAAPGTPIAENSAIRYAPAVVTNPGKAALAIQFTADTPLAVERAVVETWKLLYDDCRAEKRDPALTIRSVYEGSQRDDDRSWLDFHDGLSNLVAEEREGVIFIDGSETPELAGATYMMFIRLRIDHEEWRRVKWDWSRRAGSASYASAQEQIIGRSKLGGFPIVVEPGSKRSISDVERKVDGPGHVQPGPSPPSDPTPRGNRGLLRQSHIVRVNHFRDQPVDDPASKRIFRQGYQYFEATSANGEPIFSVGLNFVSFQKTPHNPMFILRTPGWLGVPSPEGEPDGRGFGGPYIKPDPPRFHDGDTTQLIEAYAAGMFFVPPAQPGDSFPGESILAPRAG